MSDAMTLTPAQITRSAHTLHNPADPRHYMRVRPVGGLVVIYHGDREIARSRDALLVLEAGNDIYLPCYYLPPGDVSGALANAARTGHCPIKGDWEMLDGLDDAGAVMAPEIAWTYHTSVDMAPMLKDRIGFSAAKTAILHGVED